MANDILHNGFDDTFRNSDFFSWLPWIGCHYNSLAISERIMVVGESHYCVPNDEEDIEHARNRHMYENYTRDVVSECLVNQQWRNRTLDTIPKVFLENHKLNRSRFWSNLIYYNFVQRLMDYSIAPPERPTWEDFVAGWKTFIELVKISRPSYCVFIGVEAFHSFNYSMEQSKIEHSTVEWADKIGSTYARRATITLDGKDIHLIGMQHFGKFFSWSRWNDYLNKEYSDLMVLFASKAN